MNPREVTTPDKTRWSCVQAYAGLSTTSAEPETTPGTSPEGTVTVVCTPSGGAQTVRLELAADWQQALSDEELASAIEAAQ